MLSAGGKTRAIVAFCVVGILVFRGGASIAEAGQNRLHLLFLQCLRSGDETGWAKQASGAYGKDRSIHMQLDLGLLQLALKENAQAIRTLRAIADMDPTNIFVLAGLQRAYWATGDVEAGLNVSERALRLICGPDSRMYYESLGNMLWQIDSQRACEIFREAYDNGIATDGILTKLVICMDERDRDFAGAVTILDRYGIRNSYAVMVRGDAAANKGDNEGAIRYYKEAMGMSPGDAHLMKRLAGTYEKVGRMRDACDLWKECLRLMPAFQPALEGCQRSCIEQR
jgi:tetratricopeptide (TPR) repeat protein